MGREIDSPPGAFFIKQPVGAPLGSAIAAMAQPLEARGSEISPGQDASTTSCPVEPAPTSDRNEGYDRG